MLIDVTWCVGNNIIFYTTRRLSAFHEKLFDRLDACFIFRRIIFAYLTLSRNMFLYFHSETLKFRVTRSREKDTY